MKLNDMKTKEKKLNEGDNNLLKYGIKTKTKGLLDCAECVYGDALYPNICLFCPDSIGFAYHYRPFHLGENLKHLK
jgi:hypothetical protein